MFILGASSFASLFFILCVCLYSHRPVDIHNMYNVIQVKLLMKPEDLTEVPSYDEVFRDDEVSVFLFFHLFNFFIISFIVALNFLMYSRMILYHCIVVSGTSWQTVVA